MNVVCNTVRVLAFTSTSGSNSLLISSLLQTYQLDRVCLGGFLFCFFHFLSALPLGFPSSFCMKSFSLLLLFKHHFHRRAFPDAFMVGLPSWEIQITIVITTTIILNIYFTFLCTKIQIFCTYL